MKQYFEKQLVNGVPLTTSQIEETILKSTFTVKFTEEYRNRVGTFEVYYALREMLDDKVMIRVERIYDNEIENLPNDWVFENKNINSRDTPIFQSKAYQDWVVKQIGLDE